MIALDDRARVKNDPTPERTSMNGFLRPWCICIMWTWSARSLYVSVPNSPAASYEMVKIIIFPIGFGMFPQLFLCLFLPAAPPYCWRFCIKGCGIVSHMRETHHSASHSWTTQQHYSGNLSIYTHIYIYIYRIQSAPLHTSVGVTRKQQSHSVHAKWIWVKYLCKDRRAINLGETLRERNARRPTMSSSILQDSAIML